MDLTPPGIAAFVRVAELGSFTRAAHALGVTPSGIGKSIARLEDELGVRLLQRSTRKVSLTDDGVVFLEHGRRVLEELDAARSSLSTRRGAALGHLRVSLPLTLGRQVVVPALPGFLARYPGLRVEISFSDRRVSLLEDGIDVAIRIGELRDSSLVAKRVGVQQNITIGCARQLAGRRIETIGDLTMLPAVVFRMPSTGTIRPWRFRSGKRAIELRPTPVISLDDGEAIVSAVAAGLGIGQIPSYMATAVIAAGEVIELLPSFREGPLPISAVYPSQRHLPARTRAFIELVASLPGLAAKR
jgi:LysR family transcriptional regulator, regulator for bpeEF and oprC